MANYTALYYQVGFSTKNRVAFISTKRRFRRSTWIP